MWGKKKKTNLVVGEKEGSDQSRKNIRNTKSRERA